MFNDVHVVSILGYLSISLVNVIVTLDNAIIVFKAEIAVAGFVVTTTLLFLLLLS
jgi:hypothetical protein